MRQLVALGIAMFLSACVGTTDIRMNHGGRNAMADGCVAATQFKSWYDGVPPMFTTPANQFETFARGLQTCEMGRADAAYVTQLRATADYYVQEANAAGGSASQRLLAIEKKMGRTADVLACHDELIKYGVGDAACAKLERAYRAAHGDSDDAAEGGAE
ncbi:hypothetical protein HY632_01560 [Candidatus Uhrbacteria bacterium]|nr:hypothetical protein [Candidatus Uhrbacteria bacterium]